MRLLNWLTRRSINGAALLVDAENCRGSRLDTAVMMANSLAPVALGRAFGDWSKPHMIACRPQIERLALQPIQCFTASEKKNGADVALAIDAIELLFTRAPRCFIIVSDDADYTPLAWRLRASRCRVIGIGSSSASSALAKACTEFIHLAAETKKSSPLKRNPVAIPQSIIDRLIEFARTSAGEDGWSLLSAVGALAALEPSLAHKTVGYRSFRAMAYATGQFHFKTASDGTTLLVRPRAMPSDLSDNLKASS